eukprot:jgi/Tetstr1/430857/TSEL_001999.t1
MPPRPVPEDALVDDAPGGATAASIAELEKRLTAQAEALEKRLAEQFEAATAALLARLAPPVLSPPPKGTQPAIPAGAPTPEGGEQGAQEPLPAELDALDTELEYVDFAYFGQVPPSGLEPPPRDGDEPRLWILTGDDTELAKRLTAQAIALEKRLAKQFEAATAALLARLAPPVLSPPPKGTQPAIPAGAPAPEGGEQGAQEPLPAELDALDTELEYVDFAYFGQVPPSGLEPPQRDGDEPRLWILTDDTAAHGLAEQRGLTAYDKLRSALDGVDGGRAPPSCRPLSGAGLPTKFWSVSPLEPSAAWSFSATPTDWLRDARLAAVAQPPPSVTWTRAAVVLAPLRRHAARERWRFVLYQYQWEVEAFAEAVDATILAAVERVLGVSFDPSTYGTDTNPVVTDFLAELLHDPDPMAADVATLSEDAVARARSRLHLPTRLKGAGIRRMATVRDAAFVGCMNAILPRFLTRNSGTNTPTPGFFDPQLGSVLGRGSFNANSSARQYDHFLNDAHGSDSYAAEMREAWGRLQAATAGHLGDADARQMEREVEAASGSQKELTAFLDQANNSRLRRDELNDLVPDAELSLPAFNVVTGSYDPGA